MVTHDCDIAAPEEREPQVEVIIGRRIEQLGADTNAKTARRLHLVFEVGENEVAVELLAASKTQLPKQAVLGRPPLSNWVLAPDSLVTLQHWLAARYRRAAFADEFEARLKAKPGQLERKIAKALGPAGLHVLAVLFDVDEGAEVVRTAPDDVYRLRITLLYDSTKDEPAAFSAAQKAAATIEDAFESAFFDGVRWTQIQLLSCDAVSDSVMTVAESRLLKRWRLDHVSLADEPHQPMLDAG
ncbi:hypothetical protein ABXN37_19990 [Piscinibacter sakaiensis]|uniref:Uncharacterized protein n=1 Tax=Piscinibacter sakaiensis TaxID=1547922 RepID=A0A0K8P4C8_PISS1|nr:hypothetical protein [Piscinibacter sakaiensis]GAP37404.1 hypothetical protein ISF6_3259 [Piscinibacter sakaiensis]